MTLYDHGAWSLYAPITLPAWATGLYVSFSRNDATGEDWYEYRNAGNISNESVKLFCRLEREMWVVKVATVDQSRLIPFDVRVVELYDVDMTDPAFDPQSTYEGKAYDVATNTLVEVLPPPVVAPSSASKLGLKRAFAEQGKWEQVRVMIASDSDVQEEWDLAMEIKRTDPLVQGLISALQFSSEQVDQLIIRAKALVQ